MSKHLLGVEMEDAQAPLDIGTKGRREGGMGRILGGMGAAKNLMLRVLEKASLNR